MPYLGSAPATSFLSMTSQSFTGGSGTSFTLNKAVSTTSDIAVFVNNVRQSPVNSSYSVSGTTLTMSASIASSDNFYVVFLGSAVGTINPASGSVGTSQLADSSVSLAKLSATGTKDATTFLRGDNSFAEAGGGKVLQVVSVTKTDTFSTSSNTFVDIPGLSASITPSNSSNKILVQGMISVGSYNTGISLFVIDRDGTDILKGDSLGGTRRQSSTGEQSSNTSAISNASIIGLDSPSSTSSLTYKIQFGVGGGGTHYINRTVNNTDGTTQAGSSISTLTLTEIGA